MGFLSSIKTSYTPNIESGFDGIKISIFKAQDSAYQLAGIYRLPSDLGQNNFPFMSALVIVIVREYDSHPISYKLTENRVFFVDDDTEENQYRIGFFNFDLRRSLYPSNEGNYFIHVSIFEVCSNIVKLTI